MNSLVACIIRDSNGVVACVARDEEVEKISKKLSGKADFDKPTFDEPVCYVAKNYLFVYHVAHGICYWTTSHGTDSNCQRLAIQFLQKVKSEVDDQDDKEAYIKEQMRLFNLKDPKILKLMKDVQEVKQIGLENVERLTEREGNLHLLKDQTEELNENSKLFVKSSKDLKCTIFRENVKVTIVLIASIVCCVFVYLAVIAILFGLLFGVWKIGLSPIQAPSSSSQDLLDSSTTTTSSQSFSD